MRCELWGAESLCTVSISQFATRSIPEKQGGGTVAGYTNSENSSSIEQPRRDLINRSSNIEKIRSE